MTNALLKRFGGLDMAVLGDLAADCYVETRPERLSREAPVLVLKYERRRYAPGCAANTVMNLRVLGAEVHPVGVLGDDEPGRAILGAFVEAGISTDAIVVTGKTTVKIRLMSGDVARPKQQMLRVDIEPETTVLGTDVAAQLRSRAQAVGAVSGIVVSDYRYGAAAPEILSALREGAPDALVSIDSRHALAQYPRVDLATPNDGEAAEALGYQVVTDDEAVKAATNIRALLQAEAVLLTRGNRGMVLCDGETHLLPIFGSSEIVDPSGAGDTVVAVAALARAAGASYLEAAHLANRAAGVSVMKAGAVAVTRDEILGAESNG
jgi:rfaE bifunctional protein kinase chain/domain